MSTLSGTTGHLRFYLYEIKFQCGAALEALRKLPPADTEKLGQVDADAVYRDLQAGLGAAANLSKLLWSDGNRQRAESLRRELDVDGGRSPLRGRALRNHFEHFDERIDRWLAGGGGASLVNRNVQPLSRGVRSAVESGRILHHYDPMTYTAYFQGEAFPIQPVIEEIERIAARLAVIQRGA